MEKIGRKGFELLRGLHQPPQHRMGVDFEHPCRAPDAQAFGQTGDDAHDELHRRALPMQEGAVRLRAIALARDALELVPGLAPGLAVGADIAAAEPAVIRAVVIGTQMPRGIDGALASPRKDDHRRWRARGFGTRIESLLTRLAYWFVDVSGKGFGFFGGFLRIPRIPAT